jgi:hypothetical protein
MFLIHPNIYQIILLLFIHFWLFKCAAYCKGKISVTSNFIELFATACSTSIFIVPDDGFYLKLKHVAQYTTLQRCSCN